MKKVLIALDYAPAAEKVAETGYALAKAMQAEVVLVHITADASYYSAMAYSPVMGFTGFADPQVSETLVNQLESESQRFLSEVKSHLGDEGISILVLEGDTAEGILQAAEMSNADIIVTGTHSRKGLGKLLMGSVAERVLHHSKIPVFIIPTKDEKQ